MKRKIIFFGAAGSAVAYCQHTKTKPDFFVDNDEKKWGTFVEGVEVMHPEILKTHSRSLKNPS